MKSKMLLIFLSTFFISTLEAAQNENKLVEPLVNTYLKQFAAKEHFTGIAASVFIPLKKGSEKGIISSAYAGLQQVPPPEDLVVTANNLFEIGSITKSYVAAILLQLE